MEYKDFKDIDINDSFFESLKSDYKEFPKWYQSKSDKGDKAYVIISEGVIEAFLFLKLEEEELSDLEPVLTQKKRLKIGTLKVNPHGTRLGERLMKKALDTALKNDVEEVYVTVFSKHEYLIKIFEKYGFINLAEKTTHNGTEQVYVKSLKSRHNDVLLDYPRIVSSANKYLLAIYPEYHTRLLPDSKLYNESFDLIADVSHTNSIHKVYICRMQDLDVLQRGDILVVYRTGDGRGPAKYRAVATSVGVVEEVKKKSDFKTENEYLDYCKTYSVFEESELKEWFKQTGIYVIRFTYNFALNKRIIRDKLINDIGLDPNKYWGFFKLSDKDFDKIIEIGEVYESFIID